MNSCLLSIQRDAAVKAKLWLWDKRWAVRHHLQQTTTRSTVHPID